MSKSESDKCFKNRSKNLQSISQCTLSSQEKTIHMKVARAISSNSVKNVKHLANSWSCVPVHYLWNLYKLVVSCEKLHGLRSGCLLMRKNV
jgi:hypothetical protein